MLSCKIPILMMQTKRKNIVNENMSRQIKQASRFVQSILINLINKLLFYLTFSSFVNYVWYSFLSNACYESRQYRYKSTHNRKHAQIGIILSCIDRISVTLMN